MPEHNEPQYKTKANAIGVRYAYTRVDGQQVALGRAGEGGGLRPLVVEFVEAIPGERELVEDQK